MKIHYVPDYCQTRKLRNDVININEWFCNITNLLNEKQCLHNVSLKHDDSRFHNFMFVATQISIFRLKLKICLYLSCMHSVCHIYVLEIFLLIDQFVVTFESYMRFLSRHILHNVTVRRCIDNLQCSNTCRRIVKILVNKTLHSFLIFS